MGWKNAFLKPKIDLVGTFRVYVWNMKPVNLCVIKFLNYSSMNCDSTYFRYFNESTKWCNGQLRFLDPPGLKTALASSPGSGNTWARFLIQQVSGYATGCIYNDNNLKNSDFPGEGIQDGRVIAIKTHQKS